MNGKMNGWMEGWMLLHEWMDRYGIRWMTESINDANMTKQCI